MKQLSFVLALVAFSLMVSPTHSVEGASASPRILYTVRSLPSIPPTLFPDGTTVPQRAVTLMAMTEDGNSTAINPLLFDGDQLFISPDRTKIASRRLDNLSHDLVVLDENGTQLSDYSFEQHNQGSAEAWYLWGWRGNNALILARFHDDRITFSEYDLTAKSQMLRPMQFLNDFSKWPVSDIQGLFYHYLCICDVFQFSPSFRFVKTTATLSWQIHPRIRYYPDYYLYATIWDLQAKTTALFNGESPWSGTHVAWTPSENKVVLQIFSGFGYHLYLYDLKTSLKLLDKLECGSDTCQAESITWSPSETDLAFWLTYPFSNLESQLVIVDANTHKRRVLLSSNYRLGDLRWSPDSSQIAFAEYSEYQSKGIKVFNVQTGAIAAEYSIDNLDNFLGYLAV